MMKGTIKAILVMAVLSTLALLYVHLQMNCFLVSYSINGHNKKISHYQELKRQLEYRIDYLKGPKELEARISENTFELTLPEKVYTIPTPLSIQNQRIAEKAISVPASTSVLGIFNGWIQVAQASSEK